MRCANYEGYESLDNVGAILFEVFLQPPGRHVCHLSLVFKTLSNISVYFLNMLHTVTTDDYSPSPIIIELIIDLFNMKKTGQYFSTGSVLLGVPQ